MIDILNERNLNVQQRETADIINSILDFTTPDHQQNYGQGSSRGQGSEAGIATEVQTKFFEVFHPGGSLYHTDVCWYRP